jgi:protein TonB
MLNSKFDICSSEWIERVFENRNKSYGAYDLRKHYAGNMLRSLAIAILGLASIFLLLSYCFNDPITSVSVNKGIDVTNPAIHVIPEKETDKPQTTAQVSHRHTRVEAARHTLINQPAAIPSTPAPAVIPAQVQTNTNQVSTAQANNIDQPETGPTTTIDNAEADVKPMLVGGAEAWTRFLEINLHYPAEAKAQHISGKVWISFIVERDGRISNIAVDQPAGHGFDEEAVRVLKLSPLWTPGKQNGQSIRVKYTLPIDFHIAH